MSKVCVTVKNDECLELSALYLQLDALKRVPWKEIKKGVTYHLNNGYWPYGGSPVKYIGADATIYNSGARLQTKEGVLFIIGGSDWVYADDPRPILDMIKKLQSSVE